MISPTYYSAVLRELHLYVCKHSYDHHLAHEIIELNILKQIHQFYGSVWNCLAEQQDLYKV